MDVAGLSKMCVPLLRTFEERERLTARGDFLHRPKQTILNLVMGLGFLAHGYASGEFEVTDERLGVYLPTVRLGSISMERRGVADVCGFLAAFQEHIDNPKVILPRPWTNDFVARLLIERDDRATPQTNQTATRESSILD